MMQEYGTMKVMVDGKETTRKVDHMSVGHNGPARYEPVLRHNEIVQHTIDGTVYIIKTGL